MLRENPCLSCGACCAHFRVSFYWGEADPAQGGTVPLAMTEELTSFRRCMSGTNQRSPRCIALDGTVGQSVRCRIYPDRTTPCREFGVEWINGRLIATPEDLAGCTQARAAWGLPPLFVHSPIPRPPRHFALQYAFWRRRRGSPAPRRIA